MSQPNYRDITLNGLWKNNPALVQLLGLCPLLAVTGSVVNAIGLGLATITVLVCSNTAVSIIRSYVSDAVRLPAFVMIIASTVTCVELLMQAFAYDLYLVIGLFTQLITTNCAVLGRADGFACKNRVLPSAIDGFMMGMGFAVVLFIIGAAREAFGTGHLFENMDILFGPAAANWRIEVFPNYPQYLVAVLPPGAFLFAGFLIATKNLIDAGIAKRAEATTVKVKRERVRVTGAVS
ncbi:MAG TPA: electron transport complex subunit E [Pseudomonadales bacterium]|jgi:electron transport complex protein RnfE